MTVVMSKVVPRGSVWFMAGQAHVNWLDLWSAKGIGPTPLFSRHTLGTREAERDRRNASRSAAANRDAPRVDRGDQ